MNITIRNIPTEIGKLLKIVAKQSHRSINSQIIYLLEQGLASKPFHNIKYTPAEQVKRLNALPATWEDDRNTKDIIGDIVGARTEGREISL